MATSQSVSQQNLKIPNIKLLDGAAAEADVEAEDARPLPLEEALERRAQQNVEKRRKLSQWAMTFSLLPFAFTGVVNPSAWIGYVVLINGVLCHAGAALRWQYAPHACFVDTVCNFAFCIYVNGETHWQPWTYVLTGISLLAYLGNGHYKKVRYAWVHILFVQWVLCALLYVFESER